MKIKGYILSLLIPSKWGFFRWSGSKRHLLCPDLGVCWVWWPPHQHYCGLEGENRCWQPPRKVRGYKHPGEAAVPRGTRGTEGSSFGQSCSPVFAIADRAAEQFLVLLATKSVCPPSGWQRCVCSLCLPWINLHGAGCQECITIPGHTGVLLWLC